MAKFKKYAEFRISLDPNTGRQETTLIHYWEFERKPRDDKFDIDNQIIFARVGTPQFENLLSKTTTNMPKIVSDFRKSLRAQTSSP